MMNMARKQRCNATHMDDAGYKHSCKLLTGHPGDHECIKSVHSWADYKRPMNPKPLECCGKLHEVIQFTFKGPIQYGAECSVCGKRVAAVTPEDVGWKWEKMKASKPLDARLAERLAKIRMDTTLRDTERCDPQAGWEAVADYVRKIVKETKEGK